mgnify:CR=1 FL=1
MSTEKKRRESTHTQQKNTKKTHTLKTDKMNTVWIHINNTSSEKKLTHTREKKGGVILFFSPFSQK